METTICLSLNDDVRLIDVEPEQLALESSPTAPRPRITLRQVTPGLRAAIQRLKSGSASPGLLTGSVVLTDGPQGVGKLRHYLARFDEAALIIRVLVVDGAPVASVHPISPYYRYREGSVRADEPYVLSRFAGLRRLHESLVLECPRGHAEVHLTGRASVDALHELARPRSAAELGRVVAGLDEGGARLLLELLASAGAVVPSPERHASPEDEDAVLGQWAFHDAMFHARSRLGRHSDPYGGTSPFRGRFDPLPVIKPPMSADRIPLPKPDLEALKAHDVPFTQVLESRTSIRRQGEDPITLPQLGEFLFRTARVKKLATTGGVSFRPYPGGGALHELEIYALVDNCAGLEPGLYHYDPLDHLLERLSGVTDSVAMLLRLGGITAVLDKNPQVLLTISARFQRVQNKYQSVAYSVILKDVGGLYQTMYLVATAMGLAPVALGGGHSDLFAQAAGLDYFAETSVGDFVIGSTASGTAEVLRGDQWAL